MDDQFVKSLLCYLKENPAACSDLAPQSTVDIRMLQAVGPDQASQISGELLVERIIWTIFSAALEHPGVSDLIKEYWDETDPQELEKIFIDLRRKVTGVNTHWLFAYVHFDATREKDQQTMRSVFECPENLLVFDVRIGKRFCVFLSSGIPESVYESRRKDFCRSDLETVIKLLDLRLNGKEEFAQWTLANLGIPKSQREAISRHMMDPDARVLARKMDACNIAIEQAGYEVFQPSISDIEAFAKALGIKPGDGPCLVLFMPKEDGIEVTKPISFRNLDGDQIIARFNLIIQAAKECLDEVDQDPTLGDPSEARKKFISLYWNRRIANVEWGQTLKQVAPPLLGVMLKFLGKYLGL